MICSIVVLYNPEPQEYYNILSYYDFVDCAIILDNSRESHYTQLRKVFTNKTPKYTYIHFQENIGFCKALNYGMKIAYERQYKWALLMDADSSFLTNIIDEYRKYLSHLDPQIAVLSPVHIHDRSNAAEYTGIRYVKWAMTSGCLYNVEVFHEQGGFMNELFVDGLDIDYCYRVRKAGYRIMQCGKALLKHHPAQTKEFKIFGKSLLKYGVSSPWRYRLQARSLVWLFLFYHQMPDVVRYFWRWFKVLFFFENKKEYVLEMLVGTREGFGLWRTKR